jgi:hypothetical protein
MRLETFQDWLTLTGSILGLFAFAWNMRSYFVERRNRNYDYGEQIIEKYLETQMTNPEFRDERSLQKLHEHKETDPLAWARYEAFCLKTWNSLETIQHKYKEKTVKAPFMPAVIKIIQRHQQWFDEQEKYGMSNDMVAYLRKNERIG